MVVLDVIGCLHGECRGAALDLIPVTTDILDDAAELNGRAPRSLDALHLASALSIREDLSSFVAYDPRLSEAASNLGLDTIQPGR